MGIYFGTDGLRGVYGEEITPSIAFKCGNSLSRFCKNKKVIIGKDPRVTGDILTFSVANGLMQNGIDVIDVGLVPTPAIAYLTKCMECDYGIVISASHNPPMYNGIKIFANNGEKLGDKREEELEFNFKNYVKVDALHLGKCIQRKNLIKKYEKFLVHVIDNKLDGLKIVLDCCYGASVKVAKEVFKKSGAEIKVINGSLNGKKINVNSGATSTKMLAEKVVKERADLGLAFDGDSDRVIAVDEKGNEVDGDKIIYLLAKDLKKKNKLKNNTVVGTVLTNLAIVEKLEKENIKTILAPVGDKYVIEKMQENDVSLGGEKAGHIILSEYLNTGDGILAGIRLASILKEEKRALSKLIDITLYPQYSINYLTEKKDEIMLNTEFNNYIKKLQEENKNLKILVRKSGTESLVRIMVEGKDEEKTKEIANLIKEKVEKIEKGL